MEKGNINSDTERRLLVMFIVYFKYIISIINTFTLPDRNVYGHTITSEENAIKNRICAYVFFFTC